MSERSKKILDSIEKANLSYGELSKITGIPKSALQRYATGETEKIPIDRLEQIADATNVSVQYLMGWEETYSDESALLLAKIAKDPTAKRLLSYYLALSNEGKERIVQYSEDLMKIYNSTK